MKKCRYCKVLLSNDAEYCSNCGSTELEEYHE
jgi:RNA polymerase subunit RPABC4/transcription elongation factor Spt4